MNLLGLIFGILLICACSFSLSLQKYCLSRPVEISCQNNLKATQKILDSYEREYYKSLKKAVKKKGPKQTKPAVAKQPSKRQTKKTSLNQECARLNIYPLVLDGRDEHQALYHAAAKVIRSLYKAPLFLEEVHLEYTLLDAMLLAAKNKDDVLPLEKLNLKEKNVKRLYPLQDIYYRMLKGTKHKKALSYPPLADYLSLEKKSSPLCLMHASIEMLSALFNAKAARQIQAQIEADKRPPSKERIQDICAQCELLNLDDSFLDLLNLKTVQHRLSNKKVIVKEEGDVSLRKQFVLPNA